MEPSVRTTLSVVAIAIAGVLSATAIVRYVYRPCHCNAAVSELEALTNAASQIENDYARLVRVRRNIEGLRPLEASCPAEVRVPVLLGANTEMLGRFDDAARYYEAALTIDHRPELYMMLANVQVQLGQIDEAVANYVIAVRFSPHQIEYIPSPEIAQRTRKALSN